MISHRVPFLLMKLWDIFTRVCCIIKTVYQDDSAIFLHSNKKEELYFVNSFIFMLTFIILLQLKRQCSKMF